MKKLIWGYIIRFVGGAIALGLGIWYISSSLNNASLTYTSMDGFFNSIGATDGNVANANGCFLCKYVNDLFVVLGDAAETFWDKLTSNLWILMVVGFGVFLFIHTIQYFYKAMTETETLDTKEKKLDFGPWFDTVWRQGLRIMIVGALIGAFGMGGTDSIKTLSNITIQPVMYVGTQLSLAATGLSGSAQCVPSEIESDNPMGNLANPFMCIVGNINTVMLAGAAGGFALMNFAWMGLGAGAFTWVAGLLIVIMFMIVGFDLFFQILSVIFRLIFLIIFMPLLVAASAFEKTWKMASGVISGAIKTLLDSALKVIAISLKVSILYAIFAFAADAMFPGPPDHYSAILPPLMMNTPQNQENEAVAVREVFATCEEQATIDDEIDKDAFYDCFIKEKQRVEAIYPNAFDFMDDGWGFLLLMVGLFFIYMYVLSPKIDKLLVETEGVLPTKKVGAKEPGGLDNFGGELKKLGKIAWKKPQELAEKFVDKE